jgi:hypothetical protein
MRTTVNLEPDVAAAVEKLRRERGLGVSAALNELARAGLAAKPEQRAFRQKTHSMGARIDVSNVAAALEYLEGPTHK